MADGQYRILEVQLPITDPVFGGRIAGHNFLVLIGPNGEPVGELHGMARDAEGKVKPIGNMPADRLKSTESPGDIGPFYRSHYAQEELASGDQATIMNLWNAAKAAGNKMNEADIQYPWMGLGKNSNSFASTLIAAMGLTEPPMPGGAPIMPGARSMLLEPKAIQEIQRQFNLSGPHLNEAPPAYSQPDESSRPSPLDPARVPFGPDGAPNDRALAPQGPAPSSTVTPRPDLRGTAVPGAQGPTSVGGPNGPRPLAPAQSRSSAPYTPIAPAADPLLPPLHFAPETPQGVGPFEVPGLFRSDAFGSPGVAPAADGTGTNPSLPLTPSVGPADTSAPATSPAASGMAGLIGDGNGIGDWWKSVASAASSNFDPSSLRGLSIPVPNNVPTSPQLAVFDSGLPGMLQRAGAFDPPAGGLLGLLQELSRNHPDDDDVSR